MITQLQRIKAARRIAVGLLFVFMAMVAIAQDTPSGSGWDGKPAESIENDGGGKGESAETAIRIKNAAELAYFAQLVNEEATKVQITDGDELDITAGFKGSHIKLTDDINLNGQDWTPIGTENPFKGHFDGDGHVVTGLKINIKDELGNIVGIGLFGCISGGEIRNLGVRLAEEGINVKRTFKYGQTVYVGGIVGYTQEATIRNCYVDAENNGKIKVNFDFGVAIGGIVGFLDGTITHCYSMVDIEAEFLENFEISSEPSIGGIVGKNHGTISHSYATGSIKGNVFYLSIGGICGENDGTIKNNLALNKELSGETNKGTCYVNRIVGQGGNSVSNNYASREMFVNGLKVNNEANKNEDGTDTCLDEFEKHLKGISGSEWGTAWVWSDGKLPQLLKINDKDNYTSEPLGGQVAYYASNYLQPNWVYNPVKAIKNAKGNNGLSPQTPIEINTAAELAYFAKQVNMHGEIKLTKPEGSGNGTTINHNGNSGEGFAGYYFALSDDIDLQAGEWTPIGNINQPFRGHFDGKGHVVKGLKIDINDQASNSVNAGLFGSTSGGEIRNLGVRLAEEGIKVESTNEVWVGGIVGYANNNTTIRNCYVDAEKGGMIKVKAASEYLGGIAGMLSSGTITHCYSMVDIEAESVARHVGGSKQMTNLSIGGIVGSNDATISHCYATGSVIGVGKVEDGWAANLYIGGICGYNSGNLIQNNLALNKELSGKTDDGECYVNRIVGQSGTALSNNYANPKMPVTPVSGNLTNNEAGTDTWLETFKDDLRKAPDTDNGWRDGKGWKWPDDPSSTLLPKLMMVDDNGSYSSWPTRPDQPDVKVQPDIDAADYLSAYPRLHIQSPTGVDLTVTDATNTLIADNTPVRPGTQLKLAHAITKDGYSFNHYLWGTSADQIDQPINGDTYVMPNQDIWISASVNEPSKPDTDPDPVYPPPTPIYYTVTLPQVEGATTDPGAGDHEVESWNTFRFYLMLDSAYSDSQPIVTTSRGETLTPRTSDGAYLVKYVRTDVEVRIDSIRPNLPPVANEAIAAPTAKVWTANAHLHMQSPTAADAYIYAANGRRQALCRLTPGKTESLRLPAGIYLIRIGKDSFKIVL